MGKDGRNVDVGAWGDSNRVQFPAVGYDTVLSSLSLVRQRGGSTRMGELSWTSTLRYLSLERQVWGERC